jgi:hypothetical protein
MSARDRDIRPKAAAGTPRWVKAFAVAGGVFALAFVVLHLTGAMERMHGGMPAMDDAGTAP